MRRVPLFLLAALSASVVAGCGSGGSSSAPSGDVTVNVANFAYDPTPISVAAGSTVTWTNTDAAPHTATADEHAAFDTGTLQKGDSKVVSLPTAGTYTYFCRFHPFMHGTVIVR